MKQRESSVPICCKGYILEQGFYCIVFYIKIYTHCINVWKDSTNVKSSPVHSVPFKAGVLQPHTGKSSRKTKATTHPGVLGETSAGPQNQHKKGFHFQICPSLNNHVSLAHQPRSFESITYSCPTNHLKFPQTQWQKERKDLRSPTMI